MPEDEVTRREHDEFGKRMDEHMHRIDGRIEDLETDVSELKRQYTAIEKIAANTDRIATEQKEQGERLKRLEGKDGEKYKQLIGYAATAIVSIIVGVVVAVLTMGM